VTEQSTEFPQASPMCSLQPVSARMASNEIVARRIVSGAAYGTRPTIANRSASA
jgi:hypothetical protein